MRIRDIHGDLLMSGCVRLAPNHTTPHHQFAAFNVSAYGRTNGHPETQAGLRTQ